MTFPEKPVNSLSGKLLRYKSYLMTERLLQYIWQFQYFNRKELLTEDGLSLQIVHPGRHNIHQGPDFLEACITAGSMRLVGNIELHVKSSDWRRHGHHTDPHYKNVILHVVWEDDTVKMQPQIPLLVLQHRVPVLLLQQYHEWMQQSSFIPCAGQAKDVKALVWTSWKERLLAERLQRKSEYILQLFHATHQNWEEVCWRLLAKNFGLQLNADAFESIAGSLPLSLLARHRNQVIILEALLMGQAGLLEGRFRDHYIRLLQREYRFYRHKYKLVKPPVHIYFLRMRPASFPTIRLAQLAALIGTTTHFFALVRETVSLKDMKAVLDVLPNDYWHYHYRPDETSAYNIKRPGAGMIDNVIINTVSPLLFACGWYHQDQLLQDKALQWLAEIPAEKNTIIKKWHQIDPGCRHAFDSQALIELKTRYCDNKRCLECAVGNTLLKRNAV